MPATQQLTITLPSNTLESIRSKVSKGEFASEEEFIEAAIVESLLPPYTQGDLDHWIATEGVRRYDEMRANPSLRMTSDEVFASLDMDDEELS
jgi:Arc/MetJ-type ribon-helix-helix transcriptional regulator